MAKGKGIEFYAGAEAPSFSGDKSTTPSEPSMKSGGPIEAPEGINAGRSTALPTNPSNAVEGMGQGKGSPIKGPMDV